MATAQLKTRYPRQVDVDGTKFTFRLMTSADSDAVVSLAKKLSEQDLMFMRRDITQPEAIDDWLHDLERNHAISLLVEDEGQIIGYGTLYYNQLFWNRHIGEIRVLVSSKYRSRRLGTQITKELTRIGKDVGLEKVMVYMAVENKAAQRMTEALGFKAEAILADWVKMRDDTKHDLLIVSRSLGDL